MLLYISEYYGLFRIILVARNCFPVCFCVICLAEERTEFSFSVLLSSFSPPTPVLCSQHFNCMYVRYLFLEQW